MHCHKARRPAPGATRRPGPSVGPAKAVQHREVLSVLLDFKNCAQVRRAALGTDAVESSVFTLNQTCLNIRRFAGRSGKGFKKPEARTILVYFVYCPALGESTVGPLCRDGAVEHAVLPFDRAA
jgi:hypothetical protein